MAIWVPYYTYVHTYVTYSPASPYVVLVVCTHTHLKTNMYTGAWQIQYIQRYTYMVLMHGPCTHIASIIYIFSRA
jgi:hypothetical protein